MPRAKNVPLRNNVSLCADCLLLDVYTLILERIFMLFMEKHVTLVL